MRASEQSNAGCVHGLPLTLFAFIVEHPHNVPNAIEEYVVPPEGVELDEIREVCAAKAKDAGKSACFRIAFAGRAGTEAEALAYRPARVIPDNERGGWLAVFEPGKEAWREEGDPVSVACGGCGKPLAVYTRAKGLDATGARA